MKLSIRVAFGVVLAAGVFGLATAEAANTKKRDSRSNHSKEEQAKIYKWALAQCRKAHGNANVHRVEIDYARSRYTCWIEH